MDKKYKKIEFKKLDGGAGQLYYDPLKPNKIYTSEFIKPNIATGRIELAEYLFPTVAHSGYQSLGLNAFSTTSITLPDGVILHLVIDNTNSYITVAKQDDISDTSLTAIHTFPADSDRAYIIVYYKGKVCIFYRRTGSLIAYAYSTDDGDTMVADDALAHGEPLGYHISADNTLFVFTATKIIYTTDGISWIVYHELASTDDQFTGFTELDGEYYAIISNAYDRSYFVKFDNDNNPVNLRKMNVNGYGTCYAFNNKIYIAINGVSKYNFFIWDKADLNFLFQIDSEVVNTYKFLMHDDEYLYFACYRKLVRINKNDGYYIMEDNFGANIVGLYIDGANIYVTLSNGTTHYFYLKRHYSSYNPTGFFTTPYIRERQQPGFLVITHQPLAANTTITIVADLNNAGVYTTTVKSVNTDGTTRTVVDLKAIAECDSLSFKVTLADSSRLNGVVDIELTYLYLPLGVENSIK